MSTGIYFIKNVLTGKLYIGKSKNIKARLINHRTKLNCNIHKNNHLQSSWNLYGKENFAFGILEECEHSLLDEREKFYIITNNSVSPNGYNLTYGGDGGVFTNESREKLSNINKGKRHTEETKQKLSEINKGKHLSEETKEKIRSYYGENHKNTGKKRSPETLIKMRDASTGRPAWNKGLSPSESSREKMSKSQKLRFAKIRLQSEEVSQHDTN